MSRIYNQSKFGECVCRGFYERFPSMPLQIAQRLGFIVFQALTK
jgi:hypothetical protein